MTPKIARIEGETLEEGARGWVVRVNEDYCLCVLYD